MADIEKTKELLENNKTIIGTIIERGFWPSNRDTVDSLKVILAQNSEALSALDEPVCSTCGGSKRVPALWGLTQVHSSECFSGKTKPCPDCQKPPELEKIIVDAKGTVKICQDNNDKLQSQLAKRDEAIRGFIEMHNPMLPKWRIIKYLKKHLGDQEFERIVKDG